MIFVDVFIMIETLIRDDAATITELLINVVHKQVEELAGKGREEEALELHLDMIVNKAASSRITMRVDADVPLGPKGFEDLTAITTSLDMPVRCLLLRARLVQVDGK